MVTVVSSILSFKHSVAFMPDHYERTRKCGSLVENYFRKDTENSPAEGGGPAEECEFHSVSSVTQIATAISAELAEVGKDAIPPPPEGRGSPGMIL